jgi:hypothetical protein
MKELTQIYKDSGKQLIDDLFKDYLVVTEKLSGSSFSFQRKGDNVEFYKGGNQRPINLIDRTLMVYYEKPISYIKSVVSKNLNSIPENWKFCFQYFVNNQPGIITYDRLPKNHLVLTHIKVMTPSGNVMKIIEDPRVINDWANALGVTPLLPLFKGYLTNDQKQKIKEFLNTPKEDHAEIFNTNSFAEYLLRILNPSIQSTTLQNDLKKPIESIIFKFYKAGTRQNVAAKLIDPYTVNLMKDKEPIDLRKAPADINEIILLDLLAFIEERGIKKHEILGDTEDMRYIELVSNIFNDYVTKRGKDITKIDIEKAEFAKGDEFDLNVELIPSQRTKDILIENPQLKDLFKIMVGSLKKKRKGGGNIMTPSVINDFNQMVDKVIDVIQPDDDDSFKTFDDYLKIKSTNESLLPTAEEMIVEEKVLNYNKFINLGKVIVEADVMDQKIKNPETGRKVKVSSALGYDKDTAVYKKAKEAIGGKEKESESKEDFDYTKIDKKKSPAAFDVAKDIDKIEDPEQKKNAIAFVKNLTDYENAEPGSPERKAALEKFFKEGGINRNALGTDTNKMYVGQKDEMTGKGKGGRFNNKTGLSYSKVFTEGQNEKILADADDLGVLVPMQNGIPRTNGKRLSPINIHTDSKGNKPKSTPVKVSKIEPKGKPGDKDYDPGGVKIGGENGMVMKNTPPMTEAQKSKLKETFKKAKPNATEEEIDRYVAINETFRKQNNEKIKRIQENELTVIPILDENDQEIDVFTKDGQKKAVKSISKNVTGKVKAILSSPPKIKPSPQLQGALDDFDKAASDFADGKITQEEFKRQMDDTLIEMINDPHTRPGMPDLVETFAMMEDLSQGRASVSPDAANFALADVITFDPAELPEDATPEEVNRHINIMTTSSGSRSIKFESGGASQSGNKIDATEYADFNDKIKGSEVKSDLQDLANKQYDDIYNVQEEPPFKTLKGVEDNARSLAKKYDVDLGGLDPLSDEKKDVYEKRADKKMLSNVIKEYKEKGIDLSEDDAKDLLIRRWAAMDMNGRIMQAVNNKQQVSQSFTNRSYNTDPANAGTSNPDHPDIMKDKDGKPILIVDMEGNPKLKNGKKQYRRKQKMKIKETNGVSDLACMNYSDNPGFSKTGKPTNKMPARVVNCKESNKWLGN